MYLLFLGFVYVLLIAASSSIDTCYYYSYSDYKYNYGFTSSSDPGNYRCSQATNSGSYYKLYSTAGAAATWNSFNTGYCCFCPYGKMVPPSIDTSTANLFKMTGGDSSCIECEMGSYSNKTSQGICLPCPLGTYQDKTGQTSCNKCPSGKTTMTLLLATTWAGSGASSSGEKSVFYGAYSINQCVAIPVGYPIYSAQDYINGYYNSIYISREIYSACSDGEKRVSKTNSSATCSNCPVGKTFYAGGESYKYINAPVSNLPSIYYYGKSKTLSTSSPITTTTTSSIYTNLFEIDWSDSQGAQCVDNCPYGKMPPPYRDSSKPFNPNDCIECEIGSYSDKTTQEICLPCPLGTYQDKTGQTSCNKCPSGKTTMTLLLATTWAGSGASTSQTKSVFYGAYSINQCVAIPIGYSVVSVQDYINGFDNTIYFSRNIYTACADRYKVSQGNTSTTCSSCLSGQIFFSGGEAYNQISIPVSSYFSSSIYYYGPYKQLYNTAPIATTITLSPYEYLFKIDWSDSQGVQCVYSCPVGFKSFADLSSGKATSICKKCSEREGEYGMEPGVCATCPENKYPKKDGALECSICPWPFLSHIPRNNGQYYSCIGNIGSIAFPVFCLCLTQNDITAICLLITAFFSINLFIFFYFGNFSKSLDKVDISIKEKSVSKEKQFNKRDVLIGLTCYIFVPFVDNITDLAFLLSNKFVSFIFFSLFGFFFCLPGLYFFKTLIELKAVPKFYILPMPKCLLFDEYNSLYKLIAGTIVLFPFVVINTPVLFPVSKLNSKSYC